MYTQANGIIIIVKDHTELLLIDGNGQGFNSGLDNIRNRITCHGKVNEIIELFFKPCKQSLFEQYVMGEIDVETYKSEKAACDADILKAKNAYAAIAAQAKKKQEEQARQSSRTEIAKAITDAECLTPELVNLLIEKVYVFPDKRIEIAYKVQDLFE